MCLVDYTMYMYIYGCMFFSFQSEDEKIKIYCCSIFDYTRYDC